MSWIPLEGDQIIDQALSAQNPSGEKCIGYQAATPLATGLAKAHRYLVDQRDR